MENRSEKYGYEYNKKYAQDYIKKLDEIKIRTPKGEKDRIKSHAEKTGESVNAFIMRAINEAILNDEIKAGI